MNTVYNPTAFEKIIGSSYLNTVDTFWHRLCEDKDVDGYSIMHDAAYAHVGGVSPAEHKFAPVWKNIEESFYYERLRKVLRGNDDLIIKNLAKAYGYYMSQIDELPEMPEEFGQDEDEQSDEQSEQEEGQSEQEGQEGQDKSEQGDDKESEQGDEQGDATAPSNAPSPTFQEWLEKVQAELPAFAAAEGMLSDAEAEMDVIDSLKSVIDESPIKAQIMAIEMAEYFDAEQMRVFSQFLGWMERLVGGAVRTIPAAGLSITGYERGGWDDKVTLQEQCAVASGDKLALSRFADETLQKIKPEG